MRFSRCRAALHWLACAALLVASGASHAAEELLYTVQAGDHPWNIAQRYFRDSSYATRLARLNRIPNDRRIQPGLQLRIPLEWLRLELSQVRLVAVRGDVLLISPGAQAGRPAVEGDILQTGQSLRSGAQSSATLQFEDGSRALVRQNTELRLTASSKPVLQGGRLVEMELLRGAIENTVTPASGQPGRFEIRSPSAVAAVRGTQFRVNATERQTWTEVLEGAVLVSNPAGQTAASAGSGTVASVGQAPGAATTLLAPPDLSALPERIERVPLDWPINPLPGAVAYRTELAPDARFATIVSDEVATAARARAPDVDDASYIIRMRGIDANGLEGLATTRALIVHARPEPPLLIEPAPEAVTTSERPTFRWTQRNSGWNYRLDLRPASPAEGGPTVEHLVQASGSATSPVELPPGIYQWRIAAIDSVNGRQGPWGDSQTFRRVLPGPGVEPAQPGSDGTTLRWSAQPRTRHYRVQVARDPAFLQRIADAEPAIAQLQVPPQPPGTYHVRVLSVGDDGYVGPWGAAQTFSVPEEPEQPQHWRALLILLPLLLLGL